VLYNGVWGTVCHDLWDINDAQVICRQLGFVGALQATFIGSFGQGTGTIWLDNVQCRGNETRIENCPNSGWGEHDCRHYEDAGVDCQIGKHFWIENLMVKINLNTHKRTYMHVIII